jgi:hypothetical protein
MMRARGKSVVQVLTPVLLICLLVLTCMAYAAPAATQKATQQAKPATSATSPASIKYDPNAPPQGTITINASSKGNVNASTWYTGSYQYIEWTCKGIRSNLVDVTLWQSNRQVANIWTGVATGQTAYVVPLSMAAGSYEVRVTSEDDTRIEARFPVNVVVTSVTLATPPGTLLSGSPYTITWSYTGTIVSAKLSILDSSGAVVQSIPNISAGSNGNGSWPWTVPTPTAGKSSDQYRFQISGIFLTSASSSAKTDAVLGASDLFTIAKPSIQVVRFTGWQYSPGSQYPITWITNMIGGQFKVELYSVTNSAVVQTIQASTVAQATNSLNWNPPANLPANLYGTSFQIQVTSLSQSSVQGSNDPFVIAKPSITLALPDPNQTLVRNQPYQIAWKYTGDPGGHVRIDIFNGAGASPTQLIYTITASTDIGLWGTGHYSWDGYGMFSKIYIQIQGVETPTMKDSRLYTTVSGSGATSGTVSTGSSSSSSGSPGSSSSGTTQQLKQNTSIKYNSSNSATFFAGTTVTLDGNGYAVNGYLSMSDQSLYYSSGKSARFYAGSYVTFGGGYVTSGLLSLTGNQSLEYKSGKAVSFLPGGKITLSNGYIVSGFLALGSDQYLDYASGKSARFYAGSFVNVSNGYVASGYLSLAGNQSLDYRSGKSAPFMAGSFVAFRSGGYVKSAFVGTATTFDTTKGTQSVPALSYVKFDDNGYLASFNPPGFSACYKCDPQMDPTCSNSGGLPPCK